MEEFDIEGKFDEMDYQRDLMRDDFMMIENVKDAVDCVNRYSSALCKKYLPEQYLYLIEAKEID